MDTVNVEFIGYRVEISPCVQPSLRSGGGMGGGSWGYRPAAEPPRTTTHPLFLRLVLTVSWTQSTSNLSATALYVTTLP